MYFSEVLQEREFIFSVVIDEHMVGSLRIFDFWIYVALSPLVEFTEVFERLTNVNLFDITLIYIEKVEPKTTN